LNLDNIKIRGTDGEETNVVTIVLMGGFSTPIWTPTSPVQIYGSSDLNN
jgi:hypothetical protein